MSKTFLDGYVVNPNYNEQYQILDFSIADKEKYKNKQDEWVENTTWFKVKVFGKRAAAIQQYINKGTIVAVEGRVEIETWKKQSGEQSSQLVLKASDIKFYNPKSDIPQQFNNRKVDIPETDEDDDDLPF